VSLYPAAKPLLIPENGTQPAIRPTQVVLHSLAAPWTIGRMAEYWEKSTNLEAHFGVDYTGAVGQFVSTAVRADANYGANRRADGTGAISVETASDTKNSDPWTAEQVEALVALGAWAHREHGIPLRICRDHADPGFGIHRLFPQWSTGGATYCPGDARAEQFHDVVFPGIVRAAQEEPDMPTAEEIAKAVWEHGISDRYRVDGKGAPSLVQAGALQAAEDGHYDRVLKEIADLRSRVEKLSSPAVDPAALAKSLLAELARTVKVG
jgi:hypothetical protein